MATHDDLPDGWAIAGWEDSNGNWFNTEQDDRLPSADELVDSYQTVVSHIEANGELTYYSVMYGVDGYEGLVDAIDDIEAEY